MKQAFLTFGPITFPVCGERERRNTAKEEKQFELTEEAAMSGFSSLISYRNGAISLLRLSFSKFRCFSRVRFSCGAVKQSIRDDYASHEPFGVSGEFLFFIWLLHILIAFPELFQNQFNLYMYSI